MGKAAVGKNPQAVRMKAASVRGYANKAPGKHSFGQGLILKVSPKGKSVWYARLVVQGKDTLRAIGLAGPDMSARDARLKLVDIQEQSRQGLITLRGGAPNSELAGDRVLGAIVMDFCKMMLAKQQGGWGDQHYKKTVPRIKDTLGPLWTQDAESLTRADIIQHIKAGIAEGKSRDTASRVFGWVSDALIEAEDSGVIKEAVLGGRRPKSLIAPKGESRASYGGDLAKLKQLYINLDNSDSSKVVRYAAQLLILTGLRINELLKLKTKEVDLKNSQLLIPRESMKEKARWRGKTFNVHLAPPALRMITQLVDISNAAGGEWVFLNKSGSNFITDAAIEKVYRNLTGGEHVPHGNRACLHTWAKTEDAGYPLAVARSLIDHATVMDSADKPYDYSEYIEPRKRALVEWSGIIDGGKL